MWFSTKGFSKLLLSNKQTDLLSGVGWLLGLICQAHTEVKQKEDLIVGQLR
jgi:hypothetical protein